MLKTLEANSIDSVVTDPPYGLAFMNKHWDYDVPTVELWREVLRVLKPGGHLLSFGGTRTYHRMVVAIEDAGFEIRDQIIWLYGSGFPKSMDVSKAIDKAAGVIGHSAKGFNAAGIGSGLPSNGGSVFRSDHPDYVKPVAFTDDAKQWAGWGTALKPANEPIVLARKPLSEKTVAANVLKWGTGALNIDASRVDGQKRSPGFKTPTSVGMFDKASKGNQSLTNWDNSQGRFPANLILSCTCGDCEDGQLALIHDEGCAVGELDRQSGQSKSQIRRVKPGERMRASTNHGQNEFDRVEGGVNDSGGASRFFYVAKASKRERNAGLEGMPNMRSETERMNNSDGRKAELGESDRLTLTKNGHPTVKPIKLMEYLIRLITPPNGTVLDCFAGSGSTGVAAANLGFNFIGIEREADYVKIAQKRIEHVLG